MNRSRRADVLPVGPAPAASGTAIGITGLRKTFGDAVAVDDVTMELRPGSLTALLGPSGCGKSTTLSLVAGLSAPDTGDITFDGSSVLGVPAERRPVGLVFQKPLLFPHLNVEQNVAFGLRMRRVERAELRRRVSAALADVQLADLARRRVGELSGGQEQRVALARALVLEPAVLLLDEPFSQLDAHLRIEMRELLRSLHDKSPVTTLFVTHDQAEAVAVADTVNLMMHGRLEGTGEPEMFYLRPPSLAAARFFGGVNELTGSVRSGMFEADGVGVRRHTGLPDGPAVLVLRPESISLDTAPDAGSGPADGRQRCGGTAVAARFAGSHVAVDVLVGGGHSIVVHVPVGLVVPLGGPVLLGIPSSAGAVLPAEPGTSAGATPPGGQQPDRGA